jgi:hypothetical protein
MKIEIDLPDWPETEGRGLYLLAGIEPVAIKLPGRPWQVKTGRCSGCGKCCEYKRETEVFPGAHFRGGTAAICDYLVSDGPKRICSLGLSRPFICCTTATQPEGCTVHFEAMNVR